MISFIRINLGSYYAQSPCTTMEFDEDSSFVFVGDYASNFYILRLNEGSPQAHLISKLSAHTGNYLHYIIFSNKYYNLKVLLLHWLGTRPINCFILQVQIL